MARLLGSTTLLPPEDASGGIDPMSGLGNLMDVMLVFACGLILALIAHYNVNLSAVPESVDMQEVEGQLQYAEEGAADGTSQYMELGLAYQDVNTGQVYVVASDGATADEAVENSTQGGSK